MTITVWQNGESIRLHQLSTDPSDGTPQEQIAGLAALPLFAGFNCVSADFTGSVPETDPSLWRWQNGAIIATVPVPAAVSPRQVRLLLLSQGLLSQVEAMIAQQDEATRITWQYAETFRRDDPLLNALAQNLGLTPAQIDQFFIKASAL